MAQVRCPDCGAPAELAGGRAYCVQCGWNRESAMRRLARIEWAALALIVFFDAVAIVGFGVLQKNWPVAILFATLPTLLLGMVFAGAAQGRKKLRRTALAAGGQGVAEPESAGASLRQARAEAAEEYDFLLSLPPPRPVRLTRRGRVSLAAILILVLAFDVVLVSKLYDVWREARSFAPFHFPEMALLGFVIILTSVPFLIRRSMVRDQELVENGSLCMGRVMQQRQVKSNFVIGYEFEDAAGQKISGTANDFTRSLYPGRKVPVFYDPQNPRRHIALCASWFEMENPGGGGRP